MRDAGESANGWTRLPECVHGWVAERPGSVLLETARFDEANRYSYLFPDPARVLVAEQLEEVPAVFAGVEAALAEGLYVAGYVGYECGFHFEPSAGEPVSAKLPGMPLAWLGVYERRAVFDHALGRFVDGEDAFTPPMRDETAHEWGTQIIGGTPREEVGLGMSREDYRARVLRIKECIAAGETYQANFTDRVSFATEASAAEVFGALLRRQPVAYAAMLNIAGRHILSFSPELFFRREGARIIARPMKGTMPRGLDAREDDEAAARLEKDAKNRAEHVMIVDLLRNDLGRLCAMGSVRVEDLFTVERYATLLQMTSTVSGRLREGVGWYEIFRGLFPCGSITGAPKIRTMRILRELESGPRGVYTGAIGFFAPGGRGVFNVAIRTVVLENGRAEMGVGGGIVADSDPEEEYRECLLKASFLTRARREFRLIETMLWDGEYRRFELHLERLQASAVYFEFVCDLAAVRERLEREASSFRAEERRRVRLLLGRDGEIAVESALLGEERAEVRVRVSGERTSSGDVFLRHKTTGRELYEREYVAARSAGFDEAIFLNERGELTEGAISNVFVLREGKLLTPPLACGVLPGVYRRHLLETRAEAEERVLRIDDLEGAEAVYVCNSVRGLRRVERLA